MLTKQELIDFETRLAGRFDNGELPYLVHFSGGNEEPLIGLFKNIRPGDWIFSTHRNHYHYLLAGGDPKWLEEEILAGRSMFIFDRKLNFYTSSILAATPAIAAGVAWALKRKGSTARVWCFTGDGAEDNGHLYEAVRYVDGQKLPCIFIVEDNDRSVGTTKKERWGQYQPVKGNCVIRYSYTCKYPHGGSGSGKWLDFKCSPKIVSEPDAQILPSFSAPSRPTYLAAVIESMEMLAAHDYQFVGYNLLRGGAYGTLAPVPDEQKLETPVAENLMAGLAMGMSLAGIRPLLFFERHDFLFNAMDALVNQADKIVTISNGQFKMPMIIRAVAGSAHPFYAGLTHTSDLTNLFKWAFSFPVVKPESSRAVLAAYKAAMEHDGPVLISEPKAWHGRP